jgi:prepilin-type N-terminal cleavage/methylation domain-containing protein
MKTPHRLSKRRGFSLIEILVVISILGILMGLVAANAPGIMKYTQQLQARNKLRSIIGALKMYETPITEGKAKAQDVAGAAELLATSCGLKDASVWYLNGDQVEIPSGKEVPKEVIESSTNKVREVKPTGWAVVFNARRKGADGTSEHPYPLIWTRGLTTDGTWKKESGVWGDTGGHIGYNDGLVEWYKKELTDNKGDGVLFKYGKDERTKSYQDAIGSDGATMVEDQGSKS